MGRNSIFSNVYYFDTEWFCLAQTWKHDISRNSAIQQADLRLFIINTITALKIFSCVCIKARCKWCKCRVNLFNIYLFKILTSVGILRRFSKIGHRCDMYSWISFIRSLQVRILAWVDSDWFLARSLICSLLDDRRRRGKQRLISQARRRDYIKPSKGWPIRRHAAL